MGIPGGAPPVLKYRTNLEKDDGTSSNSADQNNNNNLPTHLPTQNNQNWFGRHQSEPNFPGNFSLFLISL